MNVLELLKRNEAMTDTEAALADYILHHPDSVTEMTIGSLSQRSHCSNSTIIRLCRKLGLDGYRELRIELARELERNRSQMLAVNPDRPFLKGSNTPDIASSIANLSKQAIDATYASLSMGAVQKAARMLFDARRIVYYAIGDSCASMEVFAQLLYKIGLTCTNGLPRGDYGVMERMLDTRDLAIIVSYSGIPLDNYPGTIDAVRASGCRTIVVTANASLKDRMVGTDCFILLPRGEKRSERLASFYSQECVRYALNCIYAEAFTTNYQRNLSVWQDTVQELEG